MTNESCAHLRISYRTEPYGNGGTRGWWECDAGCGQPFGPIPAPRDREPLESDPIEVDERGVVHYPPGHVGTARSEERRRCADIIQQAADDWMREETNSEIGETLHELADVLRKGPQPL